MNRVLLLVLCIVIVACQQEQKTTESLIKYMPNNAVLVLKSSSFSALKTYTNQHVATDALTKIFPDFFSIIEGASPNMSGQISFHPEGKDKLSYLWISPQKPILVDTVSADTLNYAKTKLLKFETSPPTYYATWDSLHVHSSSKLLLESSIRLRNTPNSIDTKLEQLYTSADQPHTFYVNSKIASFFNTLFDGTKPVQWDEWSDWTAFVPKVNDNGLFFRAYGILPANDTSRLSPLKNQVAELQKIANLLPSNAQTVQAFAFDFDTFKKAASRFQIVHNQPETKLDSLFLDATQVAKAQFGNEKLIIIKSGQEPENMAAQLTRQSSAQYTIGTQQLFEFSEENQKTAVLTPIIAKDNYGFATYVNEHIYLGQSKLMMESLLQSLEKEDVLGTSTIFKEYAQTLPKKSSFWAWAAPTHFETTLKKSIPAIDKTNFEAFRQIDYVGVVEGDVFYVTLSLQQPNSSGSTAQSVESAGTTTFENPIEWGPYAVKNHNSNELEWLIQDQENQLYLLNASGKVLWKKQLDGAIQGPVRQVDLYLNKRLQLAFVTTKSFQVLDRNGNAVRGFQKTGMSSSSLLGVFDYDKQRDYRFLLSSGTNLNMYDRRMKKVSGWRKTKLSGALAFPPKHIRIGSRDYISLVHKSGKGELLHRTGKTRIKIPTDIKFTQNLYPYQNGFVGLDAKNRLILISTSGKITKKALPFETRYTLAANKNTLVTLTENKITINNQLVELDFGVYAAPVIQVINNRTYVLVWDNQSGKVYAFNRDANLLDGFPTVGEHRAMLGQGAPGSAVYLAAQNNNQEVRFYRIP